MRRVAACGLLVTAAVHGAQAVHAAPVAAPMAAASQPLAAQVSALDDRLLYQLLVAEIALSRGDTSTAYDWILDAARRTRDDALFRRAVDIALRARAGERALAATQAWRTASPRSADPLRLQLQILLLQNRVDALAEPLQALLALAAPAERVAIITTLPRLMQRVQNPQQVAALFDRVLRPYVDDPQARLAARVTLARAWIRAKDSDRALELARRARGDEPGSPAAAAVALELIDEEPEAEALVRAYLARADADAAIRLGYARALTIAHRYADATAVLRDAVRLQPADPGPWLSLGALYLETKEPARSEEALRRYLELTADAGPTGDRGATPASPTSPTAAPTAAAAAPSAVSPAPANAAASPTDARAAATADGRRQAWLMLAEAAEQRQDWAAADAWLARVDDPARALQVAARRASMLARQGRLDAARETIRAATVQGSDGERAKVLAEVSLLYEAKQWQSGHALLDAALERDSYDADFLYQQSMFAEKLGRHDEMETLLRRVIALRPEHAAAYNALGYALADRNQRLPEARELIVRALELSPGDPFITDSLGWVEFRLGNVDAALQALHKAYAARPDAEIAAHLGEVLWSIGRADEARRVWREGRNRDAGNDVLAETLTRLRVQP